MIHKKIQFYDSIFESSKMNSVSHLGYPTTSKCVNKIQMSADEETNFDIFDYQMGSDYDIAGNARAFEKDALAINGDLVNKYENGLGLDILKGKNVCWAAGNIDNEMCPLRGCGESNENSLSNFAKENLDCESRDSFSQVWPFDENIEQIPHDQSLIVPKKTMDITKIKGWRKKQFTMEKEPDSRALNAKSENSKPELKEDDGTVGKKAIEESNNDYAFVCNELDEFLDREAELKINYEIPHLSAECGIKLTSEDVASRPKFIPEFEPIIPNALIMKSLLSKDQTIENTIERGVNSPTKNSLPKKSKSKCALSGKSCKTSKENKGKSLPKQGKNSEKTPSSRCNKRSKSTVPNKPKTISNRSVNVKRELKVKEEKTVKGTNDSVEFRPEYKFKIRTFGMVMYPGPNAPLNPFIQYHLNKMRSYQTHINKRWANFAVTAVVVKGKLEKRRRMILPVSCCFKYKSEDAKNIEKTDKIMEKAQEFAPIVKKDIISVEETLNNLVEKVCKNSKKEVPSKDAVFDLSGEDISKDEDLSDADFSTNIELNEEKEKIFPEVGEDDVEMDCVDISDVMNGGGIQMMNTDDVIFEGKPDSADDLHEVICLDDTADPKLSSNLSQFPLNKVITKLLTKKFNELKLTRNVNDNVDKLKTFTPNTLELIKLNFIKENFASGYINLWYMKSKTSKRSKRVFLTFSLNPPDEKAINLKTIPRKTLTSLPNIVSEIIVDGTSFDKDDFAILYCDGQNWEIHGSVNFPLDKNSELPANEKRQVFHINSMEIPELHLLDKIKRREERSRILKWWVLHMSQDFSEVNVKYRGEAGRVSRSVILKTWRSKVPSFIEFKGLEKVRTLGIAILPTLWPYFLIGPYFINDDHGLSLKLQGLEVPFEYSLPLDRIKPNYVLKRFISSVVMHSWRSCRQVVGIWLYDRIGTKQTSFIEVRTKVKKRGNYQPSVEHAYSLSRTQEGLTETKFDPLEEWKRTTEESGQKPEPVCLVSNISKLGYIKGELWKGSVIIQHPLQPDKKLRLRDINKDLNTILRARLTHIPHNLAVQWRIVKSASFESCEPLDRFTLGGTHILCNKGPLRTPGPRKRKVMNLGLLKAVDKNHLIQEIKSMKELEKSLSNSNQSRPLINEVLSKALTEIEQLEIESISLKTKKIDAEKERQRLCRKLLRTLKTYVVDEEKMGPILEYTNQFLKKSKKKTPPNPEIPSEKQNFDYLYSLDNSIRSIANNPVLKPPVKKPKVPPTSKRRRRRKKGIQKCNSETMASENEEVEKKADVKGSHEWDSEIVEKLETKIDSLYEVLKQTNVGDDLYEGMKERLKAMSDHLKKMKSACQSKKNAKHSSAAPNRVIQSDINHEESVPVDEESEKDIITNGCQVETKDLKENSSNINESNENNLQVKEREKCISILKKSNGADATETINTCNETQANGLGTSSNQFEMKNSGVANCKRNDSTIIPGKSILKKSDNSTSLIPPEKINKIERLSRLKKGKQIFIIRKRKNRDTVNGESPKKFKES